MLSDAAQALLITLDRHDLKSVEPVLWLYGEDAARMPPGSLLYHPLFGSGGVPLLSDIHGAFAAVWLCLPKQKEETEGLIAFAFERAAPGGLVVIAAANDAGGARLPQMMKDRGIPFETYSKNKCRVVWARKDAPVSGLENLQPRVLNFDGIDFTTVPGLFSWDEADAGSQILLQHIDGLSGIGADLGCGYGYLSMHALQRFPAIERLIAIDIDARAIDCLKKTAGPQAKLETVWFDVTRLQEKKIPILDFVIMNPPFHTGKKQDVALGQKFLRTALHHLKPGGELYFVANRHLPYEDIVAGGASQCSVLAEQDGFKVMRVIK